MNDAKGRDVRFDGDWIILKHGPGALIAHNMSRLQKWRLEEEVDEGLWLVALSFVTGAMTQLHFNTRQEATDFLEERVGVSALNAWLVS